MNCVFRGEVHVSKLHALGCEYVYMWMCVYECVLLVLMWMWECTIAYKYVWEGVNACECMPVNTLSESLYCLCMCVRMYPYVCEYVCVFGEH